MRLKAVLGHSTTLLLTAICLPATVYAQAPNAMPDLDAGVQSPAIEEAQREEDGEIVVTAQLRSENIQRVPISITATSGEELEAAGITNTVQLNAISPGLNIRTGNGGFLPYIRGIGTSAPLVESPVALYVDGVYLAQAREGFRELNDIEQIAVLKGPQGTLFGRNATGGVIQITTRRPSQVFEGEVGADIDNYLTLRTDAYITGPLSDTVAYSLSAQYARQFEGYGDNLVTGNDSYQLRGQIGVRGKLLFQPTDRTSILLIGDYLDREARPNAFQALEGTALVLPGIGAYNSRYDTYSGVDDFANFRGGGVSLTVEQELGFARLVSISAYRSGQAETRIVPSADPRPSTIVDYFDSPNESFTQELRLVSAPGRVSWVAGAFYFDSYNANLPTTVTLAGTLSPVPASPRTIENIGEERAKSVAGFAQFDWAFLENTILTGGFRYTYERRAAELSRVITFNSGFVARPPALDDDVTFEEPTYRVALAHNFTTDTMVYASYNTGFKSGGFNLTNVANPSYLPERLRAFEVGLKSRPFDRRVRFNAAVYYYDYSNIQVQRIVDNTQLLQNGAAAELYGLELELEAQVTTELSLRGMLALQHSEFTDFTNALFGIPQPDGRVLIVAGDASGNRLPLAQEVAATVALDYHRELNRGSLDINVTANYNGGSFFEPDNGPLRQDPYLMLNASFSYTLPGDRVSFRIFGKNLLDEPVISFANTQTYGFEVNYSPPLTYGIGARVRF